MSTRGSILSACSALMLCACAQTLPALKTGIDGATATIKVACPKRTKTCEDMLVALNASILGYNSAILAETVKEDSSALANSALMSLKAVWKSLQTIGDTHELAGASQ